MKIDEQMLMAFADGELDEAERQTVERALEGDPALRAELETQRRVRATLSAHYGPVAGEDVPDRLLAMLGASRPDDVPSLAAARERREAGRRPVWRNLGAIAATFVVGILAGQLIPSGNSAPVALDDGMLVARGDLAEALETQLASAQSPSGAHRIGVTFPDGQGRLCRTFDAPGQSGLACRAESEWAVIMTAAREEAGSTQYRQAGSSLVMQAAQAMMGGLPLDAQQERAAREAEWKISEMPAD